MDFGELSFECPVDGPMKATVDCVEDMVIHQMGHAELTIRCPKCGSVVHITTPMPIIPRALVDVLSREFDLPIEDGKLVFSSLINTISGEVRNISLSFDLHDDDDEPTIIEPRELESHEESHLDYFASELDRLDSVDDFLARLNTGDDTDADG
ncbi:MAG: hypothetical protein LBS17_04945 [Actinomycetes bacterium]|jgi:hypothetical protein|nr:hypothetical protein [Actinomycetes bacterium]